MCPPPRTLIHWKLIYKKLWALPVPNKWKVIHWLLLRNSLFLGINARNSHWDGIPENCIRCNTRETAEHLFFHCPRAQACWVWCKHRWKTSTRSSLSLSLETVLTGNDQLWMVLVSATIQAIWKARCQEVFGDTNNTTPALPILYHLLRTHLKILNKNKNKNNSTLLSKFSSHGAFACLEKEI